MCSASIGDKKTIEVSKDRRLYLHKVADIVNVSASADGWELTHNSVGFGRKREPVFKKIARKRAADASSVLWETHRKALMVTPPKDGKEGHMLGDSHGGGRLQDLALKAAMVTNLAGLA